METLHNFVQIGYVAISFFGAIIVVWGVAEAIIGFFVAKSNMDKKNAIAESESIRQRLGAHLLLGLEIFIAADIIGSIVSPTWEKIGMLAAIVAIRTVLSYFLRMEVRQAQY